MISLRKMRDVVKTGFDSLFDKDLDQYLQKLAVFLVEGRQANLPVFVHAPELAITSAALTAGAERYAHTVIDRPFDDESIRLAVEHQAMFVSALSYLMSYRRVLTQAAELTDVEQSCGDAVTIATWSRPSLWRRHDSSAAVASSVRRIPRTDSDRECPPDARSRAPDCRWF